MDKMQQAISIGYWVTERKRKKLKFDLFEEACRRRGCAVKQIDLTRSLEDQGPFDLILHKVGDELITRAENGDIEVRNQLERLKKFILDHPEVVLVEPIELTRPLGNRKTMFTLLCQSDVVQADNQVFVPNYVDLTEANKADHEVLMEKAGVHFPCVCKPIDAINPDIAHDMSLAFHMAGLEEVTLPCIAQSFINHDGVLHKIFIIGDKHFVGERPSIKNLTKGEYATEHFKTPEVSKPNSKSHLNETMPDRSSRCFQPDENIMAEIARSVSETIRLEMVGIDVVIEKDTGRYAIIDVNPFPGYDGVQDVHEHMLDFFIGKVRVKKNNNCNGYLK